MTRQEQSRNTPTPPQQVQGMQYLPYLRGWRMYRGMGLLELVRQSGIGRTTMVEVEAQRRMATAATIGKLAKALRIKPSMLVYVNPEDLPEEDKRRGAA